MYGTLTLFTNIFDGFAARAAEVLVFLIHDISVQIARPKLGDQERWINTNKKAMTKIRS
jgi:hypothetical protein